MKTTLLLSLAIGVAATSDAFARERLVGEGPDQFINFESAPNGASADGLVIGGVQFSYNIRGSAAFVGATFGPTENTSGQVLRGSTAGVLGLNFARPVTQFSFGFALLHEGFVPSALRMDLFGPDGEFIESLAFDADQPSVDIRGGGAEYASARAATGGGGRIGMAVLSFEDQVDPLRGGDRGDNYIPEFEIDNIAIDFAVPLPTPAYLAGAGLLGLAAVRRRRAL